jgi:hypothetical protein
LVYALGGVLLAIPFDVGSLSTKGGPVPIVEGVRRSAVAASATAAAQFSVSSTGTLVYVPDPVNLLGAGAQILAIFDRKGAGAGEPLKLPRIVQCASRLARRQVGGVRDRGRTGGQHLGLRDW